MYTYYMYLLETYQICLHNRTLASSPRDHTLTACRPRMARFRKSLVIFVLHVSVSPPVIHVITYHLEGNFFPLVLAKLKYLCENVPNVGVYGLVLDISAVGIRECNVPPFQQYKLEIHGELAEFSVPFENFRFEEQAPKGFVESFFVRNIRCIWHLPVLS